MAERVVQQAKRQLGMAVSEYGGSWVENIPNVQYAMWTTYHSALKCTPFEALFGR